MENTVITIAREYGSGGRIIGQKLADELGFTFYDRKIISMTAEESGFSEDIVARVEQTKTKSLLYSLYTTTQALPWTDQIFIAQSHVIQEIAKKESCVIVGRCADYVLRSHPGCYRVFIHCPVQQRMQRVLNEYGVTERNLESMIQKEDKNRASYYQFFTQQKWGRPQNYHLSIDSSIGIDLSVELVLTLVRGGEAL